MTTQVPQLQTIPNSSFEQFYSHSHFHTFPPQPSAPPINPEYMPPVEDIRKPVQSTSTNSGYPSLVNQLFTDEPPANDYLSHNMHNMAIVPYEPTKEMPLLELLKDKSVYKIASFNAGGPGVLSASCLAHIMKVYNDSLGTNSTPASVFNLFAGGGGSASILASSFALGDSTNSVLSFLRDDFANAFSEERLTKGYIFSRYTIKPFFKVLKKRFNEQEIKDAKSDLVLYSTEYKEKNPSPKYYTKLGEMKFIPYKRDKGGIQLHNDKISNACLAASADTYYFPPLENKECHSGFYASNPSEEALHLARASQKTKNYRKILVVNFQTGSFTSSYSLLGNSFEDKITASSKKVDEAMNRRELDDDRLIYATANADLKKARQKRMDSISNEDYEALQKIGLTAAYNLINKRF